MKLKFVYGILPAFVFVSESLPELVGGQANGPVVRIRKKYFDEEDSGLLAHELVHVKQWYRTLFIHPILYKFSSSYRLGAEVEAYKEQLKHYIDNRTTILAGFLCTMYDLDISLEQAKKLLTE